MYNLQEHGIKVRSMEVKIATILDPRLNFFLTAVCIDIYKVKQNIIGKHELYCKSRYIGSVSAATE